MGANFRRCLLSLAEAVPAPGEAIVVADGDTDGSQFSWGIWHWVLRIYLEDLLGLEPGARLAGDILAHCGCWCIHLPWRLNQIANTFRRKPDLAAVIGSYDDDVPGAPLFPHRSTRTCFTTMFTRQQAKASARCLREVDVLPEMGGNFDPEIIINPRFEDYWGWAASAEAGGLYDSAVQRTFAPGRRRGVLSRC